MHITYFLSPTCQHLNSDMQKIHTAKFFPKICDSNPEEKKNGFERSDFERERITVKGDESQKPKSPNVFDGLLDSVVEVLPFLFLFLEWETMQEREKAQ